MLLMLLYYRKVWREVEDVVDVVVLQESMEEG